MRQRCRPSCGCLSRPTAIRRRRCTIWSFEFDKRITENFGFSLSDGYNWLRMPGAKTATGWENLEATLKYKPYVSAEHEFMVSIGVSREFARTGATGINGAALDNDDTSSTTPTIYWGKGFGDLPIGYLRPLALTGTLGYTIADKKLKVIGTDPDSGDVLFNNGISNAWSGGLSLQYSMRYLQGQVKDLGLPEFVNRLTPVVEVAWSSPASRPSQGSTQYLFGVGVNYTADWYARGCRGADPGQQADRLACRRDRAVPSLLRRPASHIAWASRSWSGGSDAAGVFAGGRGAVHNARPLSRMPCWSAPARRSAARRPVRRTRSC